MAPAQPRAQAAFTFEGVRPSNELAASAAEVLSNIAAARNVHPARIAEGLALARGRIFSTLFGGEAADLADVAADDFVAIIAATGATWEQPPQSWGEAALRLQRACVLFHQASSAAAAAPAAAAAAPQHAGGGGASRDEIDEARTSITVSSGTRAAASTILKPLSTVTTVAAEAAAITEMDPVREVERLRATPYGYSAMAHIYSDGTSIGSKLPARGEPRQ